MPPIRIPRPVFDPAEFAFCTKCREVKARSAFPKNRSTKSGLHAWCLACNNGAVYAWENSPANYRHRRDMQAINQRRYRGNTSDAPVRALTFVPHSRKAASA